MPHKWSTERARKVGVNAVIAIHVPNSGIHALLCFPCALPHSPLFFTGGKERTCVLVFAVTIK